MGRLSIGFIATIFLWLNFSITFAQTETTVRLQRQILVALDQAGQQHSLIVPFEPLGFDMTLEWALEIDKRSLTSEQTAAAMTIQPLGLEVAHVERYFASGRGSLVIPRGSQYKIDLSAGEYTRLFSSSGGASLKLRLQYDEALVRVSEGDKPYTYHFEVEGPNRFTDWRWIWSPAESSRGRQATRRFLQSGPAMVVLEGRTADGVLSQNYHFEWEVAPLISFEPQVAPLSGPADLAVQAEVHATVNYGQKAAFTWNFGNGFQLTGREASTSYSQPGSYNLGLTVQVAEYTFRRNWLVEVTPLAIEINPLVTPLVGTIPFAITGTVHPVIQGGPVELRYTWQLNGKSQTGETMTATLTEPGDYLVVLKTEDRLHPRLALPEQVFTVRALAPRMILAPTATATGGIIPLEVAFTPNLTVTGSPTDLEFRWEFGDGTVSFEEKPVHIFKTPGDYEVRLVVTDRLHLGNVKVATLRVTAMPPEVNPKAMVSSEKGLVPLTVKFNGQAAITGSPCEPQYIWDFGDGTLSYEQNPVHTYRFGGIYTVTLEVKDRLHPGVSGRTSLQVEAQMPKLDLTVAVTPQNGKAPLTIQGQAWADKEGGNGKTLTINWEFGDGFHGEGLSVEHTFERPGTYNVVVLAIDEILGVMTKKTVKVVAR